MSLPLWEECAWVKNGISTTSGDHIAQPQGEFDPLDPFSQSAAEPKSHVFPLDVSLSSKIYLHLGQGYKVPADCLVIGQNEQLSDRTEDNLAVFILGGPSFEEELQALAPIQTGDSTITSGGTLPFNWVVHAVGPRYDERFLSASDQALYSAYRNALVLAADKNVQDIVITCIYSKRKKYPRFEAAHVALRTVRKFLQHPVGTGFRRIMFSVPEQDDFEIYSALLSAYFPRNQQEVESQINLLPKELGDAWGQIILDDRRVSISAGPKPLPKESMEEYRKQNNPVIDEEDALKPIKTGTREILDVGERPTSMADMGGDKDEERRKRVKNRLVVRY